MKQTIQGCLVAVSFISLLSCSKVLDKQPIDIINEANVWNDNRLAEAYLDQTLSEMIFMYSEVNPSPGDLPIATRLWYMHDWITMSDEARHAYTWYYTYATFGPGLLDKNGGFGDLWLYPTIRETNVFIEKMETSTLPNDQKTELVCRARWARAMCYFAMVKRYGGIPLITTAQSIDEPFEDLFVPRSKEVEVYDFIINEMNAIFPLMQNTRGGYPTKWAAMALKSRAALYAASIATWGEVQLQGIDGIPAADAERFWNICYNASDSLIKVSGHSLYEKYPDDRVWNFRQLFVDKSNPESIFSLQFSGQEGVGFDHGWDMFTGPQGFVAWAGNVAAPYLEMIEEFENADGSPGTFDREKYTHGLWTIDEVFGNKEPRFFASIYTQSTPWKGDMVRNYSKLIEPDGTVISSGAYNGVPAKGKSNFEAYATGFGIMKYLDETKNMPGNWSSNTYWMVFRLGEMYLNQAEACMELGKPGEALDLINAIRRRAGVAPLTSIDREKVRHERKVELAFESHRLLDLRRWRTAVDKISRPFSGVVYSLDYNSYAAGTPKYKIEVVDNVDGDKQKKFFERHYYLPITASRIANNSSLVENPGY